MRRSVTYQSIGALALLAIVVAPAFADSYTPGATSFFNALEKKANAAAGGIVKEAVTSLETVSAGDFPYFWKDGNANFNENTFNFIDRVVVPTDTGAHELSEQRLSNQYANIIDAITYQLSTQDQIKINQAKNEAETQATAVVSAYQQKFGPITQDEIDALKLDQVATKIDYVINYKVARVWSCAESDPQNNTPLNFSQDKIRNLSDHLNCLPSAAMPLLGPIQLYLNKMTSVFPLINAQSNALWTLGMLKDNTESPSTANGGMTTVSDDGSRATQVGYTINEAVTTIQNDLKNERQITLEMEVTKTATNTVSVDIEGHGAVTLPIDFISVSGSGASSFHLYSFKGVSSKVTVKMAFPGWTYVPIEPARWNQATLSGWFDSSPIQEAIRNGQDYGVTGYHFATPQPFRFGKNGNFGRLAGVMISQYPTITITYAKGEINDFRERFAQSSKWSVKLFGFIPLGGGGESVYQASAKRDQSTGAVTVTYGPSDEVFSVPDLDLRTYVIAAVIDYPGATD